MYMMTGDSLVSGVRDLCTVLMLRRPGIDEMEVNCVAAVIDCTSHF